MREKGGSIILLFFVISLLVLSLSTGGVDLVKQIFERVSSQQEHKDDTSIAGSEDLQNSGVETGSNSKEETDISGLATEFAQNKNLNTVMDEGLSFDSSSVQDALEELKIKQNVTAPPPLVVENKYSSISGKGALSDSGIFMYTNIEREKIGLDLLTQDDLLTQAATTKLNHMFDEQYFWHFAPAGEGFSHWVKKVGYEYISVSENLARGNFKSSEDMVTAWMNSPGHRANILKEGYTEIGVAVGYGESGGDDVWLGVQIFATPLSVCPAVDKTLQIKIDMYNALVTETKAILESLQPTVAEMHPETQAEYEEYLGLLEQYNKLVVKHNDIIEDLRHTVSIYNEQVKVFNACTDTK